MRGLVMALLALAIGCEGEHTMQCGYACKNTGLQMLSYSTADGCKCVAPPAPCGSGR